MKLVWQLATLITVVMIFLFANIGSEIWQKIVGNIVGVLFIFASIWADRHIVEKEKGGD